MRDMYYNKIARNIVKQLFNKGCWGKGHILVIRLLRNVPNEYKRYVKNVLKKLSKEEIILFKKTKHGLSLYLNVNKRKEIDDLRDIKIN